MILITIVGICVGIGVYLMLQSPKNQNQNSIIQKSEILKLPEPQFDSNTSVEEALSKRRSIREYSEEPLTLTELSQLLWAAQGITNREQGFRTAPSAGALYPLELYVAVGNVTDLPAGIYHYQPDGHVLLKVSEGDKRIELSNVALGQSAVRDGAVVIVFAAIYERTTSKYGDRAIRYVHIELGHAAQNVYLQAVSLDLGTVVMGAFDDQKVKEIMHMQAQEQPLYLMPIGRK